MAKRKSITAVLDRVRKLRRLATSPNPHEAALAAAKAEELVERHHLQMALSVFGDCRPRGRALVAAMQQLVTIQRERDRSEAARVASEAKHAAKLEAIEARGRKLHLNTNVARGGQQ